MEEGREEERRHVEAGAPSGVALVAAAEATPTADVEVDEGSEEEGRHVAAVDPATAESATAADVVVNLGAEEERRPAGVGAPSGVTVTAAAALAVAVEAAVPEAALEEAEKEAAEEEKEGSICSICDSRFTCHDGAHRISCIPCGHVFGRSCLEMVHSAALERAARPICPACNVAFRFQDIINMDECSRIRVLKGQMRQQFDALMDQYRADLALERDERLARLRSNLAEEKAKFESSLMSNVMKMLEHKK